MCFVPLISRLYTEHHHPLATVLSATTFNLVGCILGTFLGPHHVAGPIIQAATTEVGMQLAQVGNRMSMYYGVDPSKRNCVNTAYMLGVFAGQLTGTGAGNAVYSRGGWIASGSLNIGFLGAAILVAVARGPNERGWIGWGGGWRTKREEKVEEGNEMDGSQSEVGSEDGQNADVEVGKTDHK